MKFFKPILLIALLAFTITSVLLVFSRRSHDNARASVTAVSEKAVSAATKAPVVSAPIAKIPATDGNISPSLGQFGVWAQKYTRAANEQERAVLIVQGEALAKARRENLKRLMRQDPEVALRQVVPFSLRKLLPESIKVHLEQPISGRGKLELIQASPLPGHENEAPEDFLRAELNRKVYYAFLAGHRPGKAINGLALVGSAIDDVLALHALPPILEEAEVTDLIQQGKIAAESICGVSGQVTTHPVVVDAGGRYRSFCTTRHAQEFQRQYVLAASALEASSLQEVAVAAGFSTNLPPDIHGLQGKQKLLVIPVAYADDPRPPSSPDALVSGGLANNQYFEDGSYGTVSFITTVTPLFTLPERKTYYGEFLDSALKSDAEVLAAAAGYNIGEYDFIYVVFNPIPGVKFGGRSDGLLSGGIGAISHELGHNFGLAHANYWNVSKAVPPPNPPNYPFDRDSMVGHYDVNAPFRFTGSTSIPVEEYGNPFDVMGSGGGHFSASAKNHMNWLPDKSTRIIPTAAPTSETNRVYAFDTRHISPGRIYAVRVRKNGHANFGEFEFFDGTTFGGRNYWATYRQGFPNNPWVSGGIQLNWDASGFSNNELVDTTGDTSPGKNDSAVVVGRTFIDPEIPFYLTPVAQGGGPDPSDKWIDVVVNIGPFPENLPPVMSLSSSALTIAPGDSVDFTVTATDPNGDVLAYNWDFGDGSFGSNLPVNSKTFPSAGKYVVRCEVSDMKGGKDSAYVVITVGQPPSFAVSGRVVDIYGNPLQGVRVHNGGTPPPYSPPAPAGYPAAPPPTNSSNYAYSYTDSQGYFTIGNVPAGTYDFGAFLYGYKTQPSDFANPVVISDGDVQGLTFVSTPIPKLHVVANPDGAVEGPSPSAGYFTIFRDGEPNDDLAVRFALGGVAVNAVDYDSIGTVSTNVSYETNGTVITTNYTVVTNAYAGTVTIPAGQSSVDVFINPIDNDMSDGTRSVRLSLMLASNDVRITTYLTNVFTTNGTIRITNTVFVSVTNVISIPGWEPIAAGSDNQLTWFQSYPTYILDTPAEALLNIYDDEEPFPPFVTVFELDSIATEAGNDCGTVVFTRIGPLDQDLDVYYNVSGAASNGVDYVALPGLIKIPAGQHSVQLPIIAINDLFVEGDEDVVIQVAEDPNGVYFSDPSGAAVVYIVDDDLPRVSIYAPDSVASKNGNNPGRVTVLRSGDLSSELLIKYLVTGTGVGGVDYTPLSGSVTIPAGEVSANIIISPIATSPSTGGRTVTVVLSDSPSYNIDNLNKATVTIQDNLPVITLSVTSATVAESGGSGVFTVTRTGGTTTNLTVRFAVGGSALELSDYAAIGTNVVIPAGSATATITVRSIQDRFRELGDVSGEDNVIIQLLAGPGYNLGNPTSGTVTFTDDDGTDLPVVSFMRKASSGREDSGDAVIAVRISANPATNKLPAIVAYRITGGSAVQGTNYSFVGTGRLDFVHFTPPKPADPFHDPEDGIVFIDIPLLDDHVAAGDKTFTITLFTFTGYETNVSYATNGTTVLSNVVITPISTNVYLGENRTHTFTIIDIGTNLVSIEAVTPLAFEEGAQPGYFRISHDGSTNRAVTVDLSISGTAASGNDYVAIPSTVTIPAGTNAIMIPVIPLDDPEEESAESVIVTLLPGPGFSLGLAQAMVIIVDNDGTIQFSKANYDVDESIGEAVIDVVRTGSTNRAATVDYQILDRSAQLGSDYQVDATAGTLVFAPGETLQQIRIHVIDDLLVEPLETVSLVLTNPTGGVPLGGQRFATLSIRDNDISFQFVTNLFQVNENGGNAIINVERLGDTNARASVTFLAVPGTAQGADFVVTNIEAIFEAGETNKTLLIPILDDESFEGDESVNLVLTQPSANAAVGPTGNAVLTIVDDESAIEFASPNYSVNEFGGFATVVVHRTGGTINQVSVSYHTVDGTANGTDTNRLDYTSQTGTVTFLGDRFLVSSNGTGETIFVRGDTNQVITIPIIDDVIGEGNETFQVVLSDLVSPETALPAATVFGPQTNTVVTILDNETPGQIDHEFDPGIGANDTVFSIALEPDASIVFGGQFTRVNNISYNSIARLHPDGNLDRSFNPGTGADGPVYAVACQEDGKVLVGGFFTSMDSTNRSNLARLNANGTLDLSFNPGAGPDNTVRAIAIQTNGMVVAGGDFSTVAGEVHLYLARLRADGSLDTGFAPTLDGPVSSLAVQPDGKILVGGSFTRVNGTTRRYIARLTPTGTLDTQFSPGSGPNNPVNSLALANDGKVVLGGLFSSVDGHDRGYIARLNSNGSLDLGFDPGFGANANVNAVAVQPGGKVVIGGDFTLVDGRERSRFARLRPNGSLDAGFTVGSGADSSVLAVAMQPDTAVVIGGSFTNINGVLRNRIARVHGDDRYTPASIQLDPSRYVVREDVGTTSVRVTRTGNTNVAFTVTLMTTDGSAIIDRDYLTNHTVLTFLEGDLEKLVPITILNDQELELDETVNLSLVDAPSTIDVNGPSALLVIQDDEQSVQFSTTNYVTSESSNVAVTVVRSGPVDSQLSVSYSTIAGSALPVKDFIAVSNVLTFAVNEATQTVVLQIVNDGRKEFTEAFDVILSNPSGSSQLGNNARATITILDDDLGPGSVDLSFNPGTGLNGFVKSATVQPDGNVMIGGSFTTANGVGRNHIARLSTNGLVDLAFDPGQGANALVTSVAQDSAGKIILAGAFTQYDGTNRSRAAQLLSNGKLDTTALSLSNGINAAAHVILPLTQGRVLLGGAFTLPVQGIGRLRVNGTIDPSFFPGAGANGNVYAMVQQPNGKLIVAGDFSTMNTVPRSRIARLEADGGLDNSFETSSVVTGAVQCVLLQADGKIIIGGDFIRVNGVDRGHIARLQSDGSLDSSFASGLGANGTVYSVASQLDGKILIGGGFTSVGGIARNRIARLNVDGSLDLTFDPGTGADGPVYVVALTPDEHVIVGGDFTVMNGLARRGIARLNPDDPIDIVFLPGSSLANGSFQMLISAKPGHPYVLETSVDLTNWTALRTNVAPGVTLSFTDTNAASFNSRFYRVRQVVP